MKILLKHHNRETCFTYQDSSIRYFIEILYSLSLLLLTFYTSYFKFYTSCFLFKVLEIFSSQAASSAQDNYGTYILQRNQLIGKIDEIKSSHSSHALPVVEQFSCSQH